MTWSCEYNNDGNGGFSEWWEIIDKENDIIIAQVYTEANARLIAAASDLLAACNQQGDETMKLSTAADGIPRRLVALGDIDIPDLWHIAGGLPEHERQMVLDTWHLAHDMLTMLLRIEGR